MRAIVSVFAVALIINLPIILLEMNLHASLRRIIITTVVIWILWFLSYVLLHELSHIMGSYLAGVEITGYKLLPSFWRGDFSTAYVITAESTPGKRFIGQVAPYARDLIFAVTGYILIKRLSFSSSFLSLLIFTLLISSSLFDVATNFFGFAVYRTGDFYNMNNNIGTLATCLLGVGLLLVIGYIAGSCFCSIKKKAKKLAI